MLKDELPKIVTQTVPGPKAAAVLARRRQAIPDAIGTSIRQSSSAAKAPCLKM